MGKGEGGQLAERAQKSQAKTKQGDEKSCEADQNPDNKDQTPVEPTKGKRKLKIFLDPKKEEEYKAKRKLRAKVKRASLREKRRHRVDGAETSSGSPMLPAPTEIPQKAVSSSRPSGKRSKKSTSAKKTPSGATSQVVQGATSHDNLSCGENFPTWQIFLHRYRL